TSGDSHLGGGQECPRCTSTGEDARAYIGRTPAWARTGMSAPHKHGRGRPRLHRAPPTSAPDRNVHATPSPPCVDKRQPATLSLNLWQSCGCPPDSPARSTLTRVLSGLLCVFIFWETLVCQRISPKRGKFRVRGTSSMPPGRRWADWRRRWRAS